MSTADSSIKEWIWIHRTDPWQQHVSDELQNLRKLSKRLLHLFKLCFPLLISTFLFLLLRPWGFGHLAASLILALFQLFDAHTLSFLAWMKSSSIFGLSVLICSSFCKFWPVQRNVRDFILMRVSECWSHEQIVYCQQYMNDTWFVKENRQYFYPVRVCSMLCICLYVPLCSILLTVFVSS